jgi:uncharacterized membrane protein YbhN (UPF0104 family)
VRFGDVWRGLRESDYWWVLPSVTLLFVAQGVRALRWQYLFAAATRPPYRPILDATLIGQCFNNVLPARAGEAARVIALNRSAGASRAEALATVVVERVFDVLSLLVLLFVLAPWLPHVTWLRAAAILAVALVAGTAAVAAALVRYGERPLLVVLRPLARLPFLSLERTELAAASVVRGAASLRDWRLAVVALLLTTVSWLVLAASSWVLLLGFGLPHSPLAGALVTIATGLSLVIPSSPGAVGVFETAALVALKVFGVPKSGALSYAIVLHAVNFFPYVAAGTIVLALRGPRLR